MEKSNIKTNNEYYKIYSDISFVNKIKNVAQKAGVQVIYASLLLFYTLQKPKVPKWAKRIILGALGYFIFPFDIIPDLLPLGGYVDDFGAIALALGAVAMFIDKDVKVKVEDKLTDWFGKVDEKLIRKVDEKIDK